ncbi:glycosyltransferase [Parvularcula lutaonensis]|uniref:Glycosyltransferase n=1 Tax=Parvularcula lutaonensis TaxID=491923 RepID=A0ABV7MDC8_9PROT|nr:glycosyltransferase [Parvularcula lutaonensis]GGY40325.1 hypothetical protein GCM10007148_06010 [Parvularcula lutaonensis]
MLDDLGIVVIGRNEGERLKTCFGSLPNGVPVVYVDSGSTDGSPEWAEAQGAEVVRLSTDRPFSAARARNEGSERLVQLHPDTSYVQFIDGDCELLDGWLETGLAALRANEKLAAVAGLRRERYPGKSWYNELCAYEWDTPIGRADAIGGDAIYRVEALTKAGLFDPMMMAGEEPELCLRLRRLGYEIERLDADMTLHDAAIESFGAWWKRAVRSGYAYTLGMLKHGRDGYNVREVIRALVWGGLYPLLVFLTLVFGPRVVAFGLIAFGILKWWRVTRRVGARYRNPGKYAAFMMLTNVAEVRGIIRALVETAKGERRIVEYKG